MCGFKTSTLRRNIRSVIISTRCLTNDGQQGETHGKKLGKIIFVCVFNDECDVNSADNTVK